MGWLIFDDVAASHGWLCVVDGPAVSGAVFLRPRVFAAQSFYGLEFLRPSVFLQVFC